LRAIDNLVRGASSGDVFVFYCTLLRRALLPFLTFPQMPVIAAKRRSRSTRSTLSINVRVGSMPLFVA